MDGLAVILEVIALLVLTAKWWRNIRGLDRAATFLVEALGDVTSMTEKTLTLICATGTFLGIAKHLKDGDY